MVFLPSEGNASRFRGSNPYPAPMTSPTVFRHLLNLIAPVACAGCQRPDIRLCPRCIKTLPGTTCAAIPAVARALYGVPILSAGPYRGVRRALVLAVKDNSQRTLAPFLLHRNLVLSITQVVGAHPGAVLVPVPGSHRGTLRRGYWPTLLMAHALVRQIPGIRVVRALRFRGNVVVSGVHLGATASPARHTSGRAARLSRRSRVFRVTSLPPHSRVIVVDDVMTTGGTLEAAAAALQAAGHVVVAAVVAAHVPTPVRKPISTSRVEEYAGEITLTRRT